MINKVLIPVVVILLMVIVGSGLRSKQFTAILRFPVPLISGTFAQIVLLPIGALGIIVMLHPSPELAAGLLLVVACPGGALSNYYCHLGRLNVALWIMLTALSSILAFLTIPAILALVFPVIVSVPEVEVPIAELSLRLFLLLLLPVCAGMLFRHYFPDFIMRHEQLARLMGLLLVLILLSLIVFDQWDVARRLYSEAIVLTVVFTGFATLTGWGTGLLLRLNKTDRQVRILNGVCDTQRRRRCRSSRFILGAARVRGLRCAFRSVPVPSGRYIAIHISQVRIITSGMAAVRRKSTSIIHRLQ